MRWMALVVSPAAEMSCVAARPCSFIEVAVCWTMRASAPAALATWPVRRRLLLHVDG